MRVQGLGQYKKMTGKESVSMFQIFVMCSGGFYKKHDKTKLTYLK